MGSIFDIASTGLAAAGLRLGVSAHRVANALGDGVTPVRVEQEALPGGGVAARVAAGDEVRADRALLGGAGVDLAAEAVEQLRASAAFRASLAVLRTGDDLLAELLGLVR